MNAMPETFPELESLPPDEKMILAAELWKEATSGGDSGDPSPEIVAVLEERMKHYKENPETAVSWSDLKRRLRSNA